MSSTFILGINASVDGSSYLATEKAYALTGLNTGNLAFHYAMSKILGGGQDAFPWHTPPERMNQLGKIGVIPCANHLGPHADFGKLAEIFNALNFPLVAVGLGAQGDPRYGAIPDVPTGTQNWVKEIASRSKNQKPNIGVRGAFTLRVLEHYNLAESAVITGCPTLFLNPDPLLGQKIEERSKKPVERVAVAAGHQKWKGLAKIESSLTEIMQATGGVYFVQSPIEMVALARGEADLLSLEDLKECRDYSRPELNIAEFKRWSRSHYRVFFNVSEWMECLRGFDFIVGPRIHGIMLGLQAGIPSLCVVHDSRTRELCETMQVPFVMAGDIINGVTLAELLSLFTLDGAKFDDNRKILAGTLNTFLLGNDIAESKWLKSILS